MGRENGWRVFCRRVFARGLRSKPPRLPSLNSVSPTCLLRPILGRSKFLGRLNGWKPLMNFNLQPGEWVSTAAAVCVVVVGEEHVIELVAALGRRRQHSTHKGGAPPWLLPALHRCASTHHPAAVASTATCSCCKAAGPLPSSTSADEDVLCASSHARAIGSSHRSWPRMTCISCHS